MTIEATITVKVNGIAKTFKLDVTKEATKNDKGVLSLAHVQPAKDNTAVLPFSKVYINTAEFKAVKASK